MIKFYVPKVLKWGLLLHIVEIENFSVILCDTNFGNFKAAPRKLPLKLPKKSVNLGTDSL